MPYLCSICQKPIQGLFRGNLICYSCFNKFNKDIVAKEPWIVFCRNDERRRRYQEKRDVVLVYLGDDDIGINQQGKNFIYKEHFDLR